MYAKSFFCDDTNVTNRWPRLWSFLWCSQYLHVWWPRRIWKQRPCHPPFLLQLHQQLLQRIAVDVATRIHHRTCVCLRSLRGVTCYLPSKSEMFMIAWEYFSHHTPFCEGNLPGSRKAILPTIGVFICQSKQVDEQSRVASHDAHIAPL